FDGESDEEEPGDQGRHRNRQIGVVQRDHVEGMNRRLEIQDEDGDEQQHAPGHVDGQELPRGDESTGAAEAGDQQEHGDRLHLPEEEEEQEVERDEDAIEAGLQHEQQDEELLGLLPNAARREHRDDEQRRAQEQQRQPGD